MKTNRLHRCTLVAGVLAIGFAGGAAIGLARAQGVGQPGVANQPIRQQGQYTMVAGKQQGSAAAVVYVLDSKNKEMVAVRWNAGQSKLDGVGFRNLASDADAPGRTR